MSITEKINEIIDRRIGRNGFEGKRRFEDVEFCINEMGVAEIEKFFFSGDGEGIECH